ncbi:hypothetical protein QOZ88_17345 [Blastococcus sp. BMG 814]|uniref:Uncharacterized protein n=1 Tax=Blastococcus carthaginiensis TaxID=3050034 RepID=A0ABT9IFP6_9ACTN|nr:hypothetical protein [Blastococcus carthaginiensis]MDP5184403.1 hypothetical protein [Blastococcus carthaginiensis]
MSTYGSPTTWITHAGGQTVVLPLIPLALIGLGTGTGLGGLATGVMGALKMKDAGATADAAQKRYDESLARTEERVGKSNERIHEYGRQQEQARRLVIERMAAFIERHSAQVKQSAAQFLAGIDAEQREIEGFAGALTADVNWLKGAGVAALTGAGASAGIPSAVTALGAASTGTAISSLSGAAAQNATMAWLGGGSLAAGGGGVAVGTAALGVVTIGPTLLIGGLTLNGQGEKAVTKAKEYEAEVAVAVEDHAAFRSFLDTLDTRVDEVSGVLAGLVERAQEALSTVEQSDFDWKQHHAEFQRAMSLTRAVRDICTVPLVAEDGQMNSDVTRVILKYKEMK